MPRDLAVAFGRRRQWKNAYALVLCRQIQLVSSESQSAKVTATTTGNISLGLRSSLECWPCALDCLPPCAKSSATLRLSFKLYTGSRVFGSEVVSHVERVPQEKQRRDLQPLRLWLRNVCRCHRSIRTQPGRPFHQSILSFCTRHGLFRC